MVKKPCIWPANRWWRTGTPALSSRVAYSSPSSRSTSCSAVSTTAGGRSARLAARSGEASGCSRAAGSGA